MKYIKTFEKIIKREPEIVLSARRGSVSGVEKALKNGDYINSRGGANRTALMEATLNKYINVVDYLLKNGADPNLVDIHNRTALMMSSTKKSIIKILNAGADVNIQSSDRGDDAIMEYLTYETHSDIFLEYLNLFLDNGLNLDKTNKKNHNLYDMVKEIQKSHTGESYKLKYYFEIEEYMNNEFPKYKEEWELKQDIEKYNL